jgi:hypothetical protein
MIPLIADPNSLLTRAFSEPVGEPRRDHELTAGRPARPIDRLAPTS